MGTIAIKRRWILLGVYGAILAIVVIRGLLMETAQLALSDTLMLSIVALAALSILWSPLPSATFRATVSLALTVFFAAYLASRFDIRTAALLLFVSVIIAVALSALIVVIRPDFALHTGPSHIGKPRGLFPHKNIMARTVVVGAMSGMLLVFDEFQQRRWWLIPIAVGEVILVAVVWITGSRTAQIALVFSLVVTLGFLLLRSRSSNLSLVGGVVIGAIGLIVTGLLFSGSIVSIADLLGRQETLLARTDIWLAALGLLGRRIWLGNGFSSFWVHESATRQTVSTALGWEIYHAHNGYIDIVLGVGVIGLVLFFSHLIRTSIRSARLTQRGRETATLILIMLLALIVMENTTESSLLTQSSLYLTTYLMISFWVNPKQGQYG
jgi:O-antigen ligase